MYARVCVDRAVGHLQECPCVFDGSTVCCWLQIGQLAGMGMLLLAAFCCVLMSGECPGLGVFGELDLIECT